jgi:hypothetical protein
MPTRRRRRRAPHLIARQQTHDQFAALQADSVAARRRRHRALARRWQQFEAMFNAPPPAVADAPPSADAAGRLLTELERGLTQLDRIVMLLAALPLPLRAAIRFCETPGCARPWFLAQSTRRRFCSGGCRLRAWQAATRNRGSKPPASPA